MHFLDTKKLHWKPRRRIPVGAINSSEVLVGTTGMPATDRDPIRGINCVHKLPWPQTVKRGFHLLEAANRNSLAEWMVA